MLDALFDFALSFLSLFLLLLDFDPLLTEEESLLACDKAGTNISREEAGVFVPADVVVVAEARVVVAAVLVTMVDVVLTVDTDNGEVAASKFWVPEGVLLLLFLLLDFWGLSVLAEPNPGGLSS